MKSIVANDGKFVEDHFRKAYIAFMTTPGSHHDTYASTCHRMFFSNLVVHKKEPKDCPDNDGHNGEILDDHLFHERISVVYMKFYPTTCQLRFDFFDVSAFYC